MSASRNSHERPNGPNDEPAEAAAIADLLRRAGRRPAVPIDMTEQVKAAARAQWQWTLRAEKRRKRRRTAAALGGTLAAAAGLMLVLDLRPSSTPALPVATIEAVHGESDALPTVGDALDAGTLLQTAPTSRLALRLVSGVSIRLDTQTRLKIESESRVELLAGTVYADASGVEKSPGRALITVSSALGEARDLGTRFAVRLEDEPATLEILVRDGRVALGEETIQGGQALRLGADGTVSRRNISAAGALWDWTMEVLPPFEADGRTLHAFLEWAAHESGQDLRYASPEIEGQAASLTLHGSIEGLSLREALELALLGTGLELADGDPLVIVAGGS